MKKALVSGTASCVFSPRTSTGIQLMVDDSSPNAKVLVNSGADECYMDWVPAKRLKLLIMPLPQPQEANALDLLSNLSQSISAAPHTLYA